MADKNLNDLLWSVDKTVRNVLDSQEIRNLGADIADSLNRAGEDLKPLIDSFTGVGGGKKPASRQSYRSNMSGAPYAQKNENTQGSPNTQRTAWDAPNYQSQYKRYNNTRPGGWNQPKNNIESINRSWGSTSSAGYTSSYRGKIVKREPNWQRGGSIAMTLFGGVGAAGGLMLTLGMLISVLVGNYPSVGAGIGWTAIFAMLTTVCLGFTIAGGMRLAGKNRMRKIWQFLKRRDFCKISEISQKLGLSDKKVLKTLEKMLDKKFLTDAHFDDEQTCLMLNDETYQRYLESQQARREAEEKQRQQEEDPQKAALAKMVQEGSSYIRRIREINNDLPDPVISSKLDDLEKVCQQIFAYVADHPDKLSSIRKFMAYYLPTTLKLLEEYRKLERRNTGVESEQKTKEEILGALDNINLAFHNLLDDLMENDYLDLSADISVLQSMLAQEGLVDEFAVPNQQADKRMQDMAETYGGLSTEPDPFDRIELNLDTQEKDYESELHL